MEVGIKQAKNDLSQLVVRVRKGERVFLMNRGRRVAEIIPVQLKKKMPAALRGYGMFRDVITLPPDWATQEAREQDERELLASIEGLEG
jgi:prevent-host-death family protein